MKYLYKTPEEELIDLSIRFRPLTLSPLAQVLHYLGVNYPDCWIGVRISSDFLKQYLPSKLPYKIPDDCKIPGDFDIIGGPLINKIPTDYVVSFEIKRFRYTASGDLKNPSDEFGRRKTIVSYKKYFYTFSKNNLLTLNSELRDNNEFFEFQPKCDYFTTKSCQMVLV